MQEAKLPETDEEAYERKYILTVEKSINTLFSASGWRKEIERMGKTIA